MIPDHIAACRSFNDRIAALKTPETVDRPEWCICTLVARAVVAERHDGPTPWPALRDLRNERDALVEHVEAVRALHYEAHAHMGGFCRTCGHGWPCATIRALDG